MRFTFIFVFENIRYFAIVRPNSSPLAKLYCPSLLFLSGHLYRTVAESSNEKQPEGEGEEAAADAGTS